MSPASPTRELELEILQSYDLVVGMDEVGRGALAGPLAVGAVGVRVDSGEAPAGVADSKLLSAQRRHALVDPIRGWCQCSSVGWSSSSEISELGISAALRVAGLRALNVLARSWTKDERICVFLDGNHNWLRSPSPDLFSDLDHPGERGLRSIEDRGIDVAIRIKADRDASAVAAASILAKVARDRYMGAIADPGYDWAQNKGYASRSHVESLRILGPSARHRLGWNLPGVSGTVSVRETNEGEV